MGRVAVDFGVGQGAKRSADIRSDLGQASNPERFRGQNQRNPGGREAEGQLAASLVRYSPLRRCASLAPCHPPFCLYARPIPVFQQSPRAQPRLRVPAADMTLFLLAQGRASSFLLGGRSGFGNKLRHLSREARRPCSSSRNALFAARTESGSRILSGLHRARR